MKFISKDQAIKKKLTHYFTGKPCKKGHVEKRNVKSSACAGCVRARHYTWYAKNKKQALEIIGRWQVKNKKKVRSASQRYRDANPDAAKASVQRYYNKHKRQKLTYNKQWRTNNQDLLRMYNTKRRRILVLATPVWADQIAIRKIYKLAADKQTRTGKPFHVDHIIPLQHKLVCGLHIPSNLQILSGKENNSKHNKFTVV
jgi:hypothetical protein